MFFGRPLPEGVAYAEMSRDINQDQQLVRWIAMNGEKHEMPFVHTDEGVMAVLAAMKLTC